MKVLCAPWKNQNSLSSTVWTHPKLESSQISITSEMDKQMAVHSFNGITWRVWFKRMCWCVEFFCKCHTWVKVNEEMYQALHTQLSKLERLKHTPHSLRDRNQSPAKASDLPKATRKWRLRRKHKVPKSFVSTVPNTAICLHQIPFFLPTSGKHLHCFHLLATVNNAAMKTGVQIPLQAPAFSSFG